MEIFSNIHALRHFLRRFRLQEKSIGFVPTMGALHDGHLELVKKSKAQNDLSVCSIFINPTQFNNPSDLEMYPREISVDLEKLEAAACDVVFTPTAATMYGSDFSLNFDFGYLEEIMEGKFRPNHFKGVGLVVAKLFNITNPSKVYFGKKDLQQLTVIKKLTENLLFDIEIVAVDTVRESDGLAMSSRNILLSEVERFHAIDLFKALSFARQKLNSGESVISVKNQINDFFDKESAIDLEYFEVVDTENLKTLTVINQPEKVSLCIAGHLGKVRLIDNISLI